MKTSELAVLFPVKLAHFYTTDNCNVGKTILDPRHETFSKLRL